MMLKKYWYFNFMGTSKFGGKYGSICGQIWVPDHDSQFAPLWIENPLLETVGGCPNTVLSKDLNNPSQSKTKIRNWTKKTSVVGKTHNGKQKNVHTVFQVYNIHSTSVTNGQSCFSAKMKVFHNSHLLQIMNPRNQLTNVFPSTVFLSIYIFYKLYSSSCFQVFTLSWKFDQIQKNASDVCGKRCQSAVPRQVTCHLSQPSHCPDLVLYPNSHGCGYFSAETSESHPLFKMNRASTQGVLGLLNSRDGITQAPWRSH